MSTLLKFELGSSVLQFEAGSEYPTKQPIRLLQVSDRTAGGTLQTETLGPQNESITLVFRLMTKTIWDQLKNWYLNIAVGSENPFLFTDEYGVTREVLILSTTIDFSETSLDKFSGNLVLEYI